MEEQEDGSHRACLSRLAKGAELAAEFTGVPSIVRGVRNIADESGDGWQKAKGAGQVVMGAIPGMSAVRQAAPVFNALAGTAPRAVATVLGASAPGVVSNAQEAKKGAEAELAKIKPPDYMTQELSDLMAQKAAKQKEFNALNEKYKLAGPETQRQALGPSAARPRTTSTAKSLALKTVFATPRRSHGKGAARNAVPISSSWGSRGHCGWHCGSHNLPAVCGYRQKPPGQCCRGDDDEQGRHEGGAVIRF